MLKSAVIALALIATPAAADPQADVLAAANAALRAVNTNDAALFTSVMLPDAIIVAQSYGPDDRLVTRTYTVPAMAARMTAPGRAIDERLQNPSVLIQRDLAHVWSRYTLDNAGKRIHCGVDSFGLVRVDGAWKISSLAWTAEPQGCPK